MVDSMVLEVMVGVQVRKAATTGFKLTLEKNSNCVLLLLRVTERTIIRMNGLQPSSYLIHLLEIRGLITKM